VTTLAAMMFMSISAANLSSVHIQTDENSADLWLGGDVNLGDGGHGQLSGISGIVQGAAGIVNLEGPVAEQRQLKTHGLQLWNAPSALKEISEVNAKVAGIANNHSADAGALSAKQTVRQLRAHGILPAGGPTGAALLKLNGVSIAVTAHDLTRGVPPGLAADLAAARKQADVLVATFHVTGPPSYLPRPELKRAVEIAYRAGAQIVAAHGTHVLGPVERREHGVIAWGLGNVAFACDCTNEQEALLLRVRVASGKVVHAEVIPIQAGIHGGPAEPAPDAAGIFDLLEAIGSSKLDRKGSVAEF
jgi:poly-gamma-glutamate capsule biosynthesis protein CapA/YwtB (metallophosphatase superfamily)